MARTMLFGGNVTLLDDARSILMMYVLQLGSSLLLGGRQCDDRRSVRFVLGVCLTVAGLFPPWSLAHPFVRAFFTITSLFYVVRNLQMGLDSGCTRAWPVKTRLLQTIWHYDHRRCDAVACYFSWQQLHRALCYAVPSYLSYRLFELVPVSPAFVLLRSFLCLLFFFFLMHGFDAYLTWHSCLLHGFVPQVPLMRQPHLSRSLSEFWAKRWNTVMQMNLAGVVYRPLHGRLPRPLRVQLTFVASGLLHVYPLLVAGLPASDLLLHFAYFFLQGLLVLIENACFPTRQSFIWPFLAVTIPSPLLVLPLLNFQWW